MAEFCHNDYFCFYSFCRRNVLAEQTENSNVFVINEAYFNDAGKLYISYTSNGELSNAVLFVVTYEDSSEKIITDCAKFDIGTRQEKKYWLL